MEVETDQVINDLFQSLLSRYQIGSKESMKGNDFVINCIDLPHYKYHKISFNGGVSYINSLD